MTNTDTELFELCKQLYDATGWDAEYKYFYGTSSVAHDRQHSMLENTPLYTSDYLLEKLPVPLFFNNNDCAIEVRRTKKDKYRWSANIRTSGGQYFKQVSDTPLKALLKLTLKLHEEGLL